jgi:hypothetical protein
VTAPAPPDERLPEGRPRGERGGRAEIISTPRHRRGTGPSHEVRARRRRWAEGEDRGTVTAELALGLPAVVSVLLAVLLMTSAATTQLRCADGARAGARAAALGEEVATVSATARRVAGPDASVQVQRAGSWVTVTVRRPVTSASLGGLAWSASASASARVEP